MIENAVKIHQAGKRHEFELNSIPNQPKCGEIRQCYNDDAKKISVAKKTEHCRM